MRSLARAECRRPQTIIFHSSPSIIILIIAPYSQKRITFGLEPGIPRSCREGFFKLHFLLQEVFDLLLPEEKIITCLTTQGEETKPHIL